jgi:toxin ParE1/3/4
MAFEVVRAQGCDRDLAVIFEALVEGYRALGDTLAEALGRAAALVRSIEATMAGLGRTAFLGKPAPEILPGLRRLAADRAVFAFVVDEAAGQVRVLAVFAGAPAASVSAPHPASVIPGSASR